VPLALFGALLVVRLFDEAGSFLPYGAAPQLRTQLDLSYAQVGVLLTAMPAGGVVGLGLAALADVVSRRRLAATSAAVLALTMAAFAVSDDFLVLAVASFVYGAASDGMISPVEVALSDLAGDGLDRALARSNVFATVGDFLSPVLLAAALVAGLGVRPVFGIAALAFAGYALWLASLPLPEPKAPGREHVRGRVVSLLRDPRVWIMGLLAACIGPLDEALGAAFVLHLAAGSSGDQPVVLVAVVGVVGDLAGLAVAARVIARLGRPRTIASGTLLVGTSVAIASIGPTITTFVACAATGFGIALAWTAFQAQLLRLRPGAEGTTGAVVGAIELPALLLPVLAGLVADHAGPQAALAVYAAVALAGAGIGFACARTLEPGADLPDDLRELGVD
jgi:predicted MFS family arabinose efflux permease